MTQGSLDDILKTAEHKMTTAVEILSRDLNSVRTGRATPALLDRIQVDYYGTVTPIQGVANISAPVASPAPMPPAPTDVAYSGTTVSNR